MASKQLTANVRLNSKQAEQKLRNIAKAIDAINRATGKQTNAYAQVNAALNKTVKLKARVKQETDKTTNSTKKWATALTTVNSKLNGSKSLVSSIGGKLKQLAGTYLGVMGMKTVIGTSDAITSAENKLNYINGGDTSLTQDAMNKMYTSAQKVRMGYTDMMSNVSKSMALAGDAFNNNTDMAIRFQEIMAEAYAVGGASAQEMSSSMYQLIQALGAGVLAGDELRSVREGAPLAYKEIEKFAQGVYNTEESLKDLASQGKITSDMVVAAVMNAGNEMDSAFAQTEQTFAQTWEQIKNAATRAFLPVAKMLRNALNKAIDNGLVQKFEKLFINIAKGVMIVFKVIENVINWIAKNWNWLKHIVIAGLSIMIAYFLIAKAVAIASAIATAIAWAIVNWQLLLVILAVGMLIYAFIMFKQGAIDCCTAVCIALLAIAVICFLIFGWQVALVIAIIAIVIWAFEYVCYLFGFLAAVVVDILSFIWNIILYVIQAIAAGVAAVIEFIVNLVMGCGKSISAICENIGIAFSNAWIWAKNTFWEFIADVIDGVSKLEPVINGIASLLGENGVDFGALSSSIRSKKSEYKEFVSVGDAWSSGWNTAKGWANNTWDFVGKAHTGYANPLEWGNSAFGWGSGIKDAINQWGSQFQNNGGKGSGIDNLMNKFGLDSSEFNNLFNGKDLGNGVGGDFGDLLGDTGDIAGNTGKMADSMDLAEEDLEYLRKIAAMEWKKEYTTATVVVNMENNNNINGESDLDGIVTKLSDKLREELNVVANGVYVG